MAKKKAKKIAKPVKTTNSMKNLLLILAILFNLSCKGQTVDSCIIIDNSVIEDTGIIWLPSTDYFYSDVYKNGPLEIRVVMSGKDSGVLSITGDSLSNIKMLINFIKDLQKREESLYDQMSDLNHVISASVEFANQIPDYWRDRKNNCKWDEYMNALRLQGYKLHTKTKKESKSKPPCK